jgi:hypothetical protein
VHDVIENGCKERQPHQSGQAEIKNEEEGKRLAQCRALAGHNGYDTRLAVRTPAGLRKIAPLFVIVLWELDVSAFDLYELAPGRDWFLWRLRSLRPVPTG